MKPVVIQFTGCLNVLSSLRLLIIRVPSHLHLSTVTRVSLRLCNTCVMVKNGARNLLRGRKIEQLYDFALTRECPRRKGKARRTVTPLRSAQRGMGRGVSANKFEMWINDGLQSATNFTNAVRGTASKSPTAPQIQLQNSIPTVAATGPILTREPMNFGIRRLADTRCSAITAPAIIRKGPGVLYCRVPARSGAAAAKMIPANGMRFNSPLATPIAKAPCNRSASNTPTVSAARIDPTTRFPPTNPWTIRLTRVTNKGMLVFAPNVLESQV